MKKYLKLSLIFAAVISFFAACQIVEQPLTSPESGDMIEMTIVASQDNGAQTKTHLGSPDGEGNYPVLWDAEGESVNIAELAYSTSTPTAPADREYTHHKTSTSYLVSNDGKTATFKVSLDKSTDMPLYDYLYFSPGTLKASRWGRRENVDEVGLCLTLPSVQKPSLNSYDPSAAAIVGSSIGHETQQTELSATFHHAVAYVKMNIKGLDCGSEKIKTVEIIADKPIYGEIQYHFLDESKVKITTKKGENTIEIDLSTLSFSSDDFNVHFVAAPTSFVSGDSFAVRVTTDSHVYIKEWVMTESKQLKFNRGEFSTMSVNFAGVTPSSIESITISEFNAKNDSDFFWYELTGKISNIENSIKGNFTLTDATGSVYVYGLTAEKQSENDNSFASLDLVEGDVVTLVGLRKTYDSKIEVANGYYVNKAGIRCGKPEYEASTTATLTIKSLEPNTSWTLTTSDSPGFSVSSVSGTTNSEGISEVTVTSSGVNSGSNDSELGTITVAMSDFTFVAKVLQSANPSNVRYYEKVTSATGLSGDYLIVFENEGQANIFSGVDAANGFVQADLTSKGIAQSTAVDACLVTIAPMNDGYSIKVKSGTNAGKYMSGKQDDNKLLFEATAAVNTIEYIIPENNQTGAHTHISSNTSVFRFNNASGQKRFRYFKSTTYTSQKTVQLYKLEN